MSVLEAFRLPEGISDGEDVAIKVVVGTREYQTVPTKSVGGKTAPWSSDFVFPVLNLRDNLLVILLDKNGEAISKNEIDTPSIVEQGSFEVNLLLNGGGSVHLGLSFMLTEEERRKIDVMRAAALKRREQEALKRSASTQSLRVEGEDHSTPAENLERDIDKAGVAKNSSAGVVRKEGGSERYINSSDSAGKNNRFTNVDIGNQEPTEIPDLTLEDDSRQAAVNQVAQQKLDVLDSSETDLEGHSSADLDKNEENKDSVDEPRRASLKPTSSSVKAKIKAFERTRSQDATKQNDTLSLSSAIQNLSPQNKTAARKKAKDDDAEQIAKVNEALDDSEVGRTTKRTAESANQLKDADQYKNVLTRSEDDGSPHGARGERPKQYEDKSSSLQKTRNSDLVSLSKQVLNGAISGAVLVAAVALLWAVNPKQRNSSLQKMSKQSKRK